MGARKERSRWEIIHDVLKASLEEKGAKKTRIMQSAHLDWRNFQRYFDFLLEEELMAVSSASEGDCYELTKKGRELLNRLREVRAILKWETQKV